MELQWCCLWSPGPGYRQIQLAGIASAAGWPQTCLVGVREGPLLSEGVPGGGVIWTPDQRLRVFVSSTLGELAAERQAVRDAVTGLRLVPVMFETGARSHPPRDV
jgi:uncharacterized protein DUF4062